MKKLLIGLLAMASISTLANDLIGKQVIFEKGNTFKDGIIVSIQDGEALVRHSSGSYGQPGMTRRSKVDLSSLGLRVSPCLDINSEVCEDEAFTVSGHNTAYGEKTVFKIVKVYDNGYVYAKTINSSGLNRLVNIQNIEKK